MWGGGRSRRFEVDFKLLTFPGNTTGLTPSGFILSVVGLGFTCYIDEWNMHLILLH